MIIDFTDCDIDVTANYGGSDQKRGIIYNGDKYMLKMSDRISSGKKNELNSSYSNSTYSEYICCHILKDMGFSVQETLLGIITTTSSHTGETKKVPVVACKNFIPEGYSLIEFKNIENALSATKPGKIPSLTDIYDILTKGNAYFSPEFGKAALERYWDTFVTDALFGNFDRHANNWGYLVNNQTHEISFAPIYDCGSCLYPQISDEAIPKILSSDKEKDMRIFTFPNAALELENGKKANYYEFINSMHNKDCIDAVRRVFPKINMNNIEEIINNTPGISDIRKTFYTIMIKERYEKILQPAYEKFLTYNKEDIQDDYLEESTTLKRSLSGKFVQLER